MPTLQCNNKNSYSARKNHMLTITPFSFLYFVKIIIFILLTNPSSPVLPSSWLPHRLPIPTPSTPQREQGLTWGVNEVYHLTEAAQRPSALYIGWASYPSIGNEQQKASLSCSHCQWSQKPPKSYNCHQTA